MKFKDLYEKGLDRKVNPAVSASDLNEETVLTEIGEYVFTEEIIINIFKILSNIKSNQVSHIGIWINGYYGTGKSHFLKFVNYCLSKEYSERAFSRLIEGIEAFNRKNTGLSKFDDSGVSVSEVKSLQKWYSTNADVQMVMFNIGDVHDTNTSQAQTFTTIFWNQFNAQRGYNSFNLAVAQYLEKALDIDGKFQEFKDYVKSKGYDWEHNISVFAASRLDLALQMAKEVDPQLSIDAIREKIIKNDINVSVEAFAAELKEYIDAKDNRNFRLLFFVDEVSQFIGKHRDLLLQLQSLVKRLDEVCESKVWIACTAQQTLEDVVGNVVGGLNPEDEVGKILGRFEVKVSLQGTSPEYITKKRILDKKGEVEIMLGEMFEKDKAKLDAQFVLPATYPTYKDKESFADYYPFVPYQFQLIKKVLDAFESMDYVNKEVKGNERSLINITYSIARETKEMEVGEFIPFDRFFGAVFQGSMQHLGQRAFENARQAIESVEDKTKQQFYRRVVYILFMICNLKDADKQQFSATIDNVVTLLMSKVDASKAVIKQEVSSVLADLIDKAVIRKQKTESGAEIYEFFTEEESKVAQLIKNVNVDNELYSRELWEIFSKHINANNKYDFATRSFSVCFNVDGRYYMGNSADVNVDFVTSANDDSPEQFGFSLSNTAMANHLIFFLAPLLNEKKELRANFYQYCQIQRFAQEPAISEERQRAKQLFVQRAKELYEREIKPQFQELVDTCHIISCCNVVDAGAAKKAERYKAMLEKHIEKVYKYAKMVDNNEVPRRNNDLAARILRPVEDTTVEIPLSEPEKTMKDWLDRQHHDVSVFDVETDFAKPPYGWSELAAVYYLNELVRRHLFAFNYNNNPDVSRETTAANILREAKKFTIERAKAISQEVLNNFIEAWKKIFNVMNVRGSNDSTELFQQCKESDDSALKSLLKNYNTLAREIAGCPFAHTINEAIELLEKWNAERDHLKFFETVTAAKDEASLLFDKCKNINQFHNDQFERYKQIAEFIEANRDNFNLLADDQQQTVLDLRKISSDEQPWDNMPAYSKLMKTIDAQLREKAKELKDMVAANYNAVFDDLENYAATKNVARDKFAQRESTIAQKTASANFYVLKDNAETSTFFAEQMQRINLAVQQAAQQAAPQPTTYPTTDTPTPGVSEPPQRVSKVFRLNTRTSAPLCNEADIDRYLQSLKAQLLPLVQDNDIVIP